MPKPYFEDRFCRRYRNGKLEVVLDRRKVIENDPGMDTPAMVYFNGNRKAASTYWCACGEGELLGEDRHGTIRRLTTRQLEWLDKLEPEVTEFLYGADACIVRGELTKCSSADDMIAKLKG